MKPSLSLFLSPKTNRQSDFVKRLNTFTALLPTGVCLEDNSWNIASWSKRSPKIYTLDFSKIGNPDLMDLCKMNLLERRQLHKISTSACQMTLGAFVALGQTLQARKAETLTPGDLVHAEKCLIKTYNQNTAYRYSSEMARVALWLRDVLERPLSHTPSGNIRRTHGRGSTNETAAKKLLPNSVLSDFLSARTRPDLSLKDKFYLHLLALQVACGFRAHEMATLPMDCLIEDEGSLLIRNFSSKGGRSAPRPVSPHLAPMVRETLSVLTEMTNEGRSIAQRLQSQKRLDWYAISQDKDALLYFAQKFAHQWTSEPDNRLINPDGVWVIKHGKIVDILSCLEKHKSMVKTAEHLGITRGTVKRHIEEQTWAQKGQLNPKRASRTSWDTDPRAFSLQVFINHTNNTTVAKTPHLKDLNDFAKAVLKLQIDGKIYPAPVDNPQMEAVYLKHLEPALKDGDGTPVLLAHEALLVLPKNALSETFETIGTDIHLVTTADLNRWLSGELRSRGTGNFEDAAAARLNIIDERTGAPAVFTWHDVRHWLNTAYETGGLNQEQIAMMFNRKDIRQNSVYSHIPSQDRTQGIKALVDTGAVTGPLADAVGLLSEHSREDAEKYLAAMTRTHTPMPHGLCTLNWALETCPHHMSCFSCNTDSKGKGQACEHLAVDTRRPEQLTEIERIRTTSQNLLNTLEERELETSPAYTHHKKIVESTSHLLKGQKQ